MSEQTEERATIEQALEAWEQRGPTSLTVALLADALYGARDRLAASEAVADSMQHFADVAVRAERKSNEYAARLSAVEAEIRRLHIAGDLTNAAANALLTAGRAAVAADPADTHPDRRPR